MSVLKITVWNEYVHERNSPEVAQVYPDGIHQVIAEGLQQDLGDQVRVTTATLDEPDQGLSDARLRSTDVLLWWGHAAHLDVEDALSERVANRVLEGMGLVVLHSAHDSKPFKKLMGTDCQLRWREDGRRERLWIVDPGHPIVDGLDVEFWDLPQTEMYGEQFGIPAPDELIMISSFEGGEVFRSACTWRRGKGKIFYFRPGHETYPIYHDQRVRRVLANASQWAAPAGIPYERACREAPHT